MRSMADGREVPAPICTISMATLGWRTLKNVDAAIYEDGDVVVRRWAASDYVQY
jgi:hypothetical protein